MKNKTWFSLLLSIILVLKRDRCILSFLGMLVKIKFSWKIFGIWQHLNDSWCLKWPIRVQPAHFCKIPRHVDVIPRALASNCFDKDCGLRPFVPGSTDRLTFIHAIPLASAICVVVREAWRSFSAAVGRSRRVSEVERNFALEVRPRRRTWKSVKLSTALPLEKHDSTHVIGEL